MMSTVSKSTREARTREFISITGASTTEAARYLKASNWRIESALDGYFNDPRSSSGSSPSTNGGGQGSNVAGLTKNLEGLWKKYSDTEEIGLEGTMRYCEDISVNPEELEMLGLAWFTKAPTMGRFTKSNWVKSWVAVQGDTIEKQKEYVDGLRNKLKQPDTFREVYNYSFDYAKQEGQKSMPFEIAQELWNLLIPLDPGGSKGRFSPERLEMWNSFLIENGSKVISKDTWILFLEFTRTIDDKFEQYDEEAAWPSLIDDFVAYVRKRL